MGFSPAILLCVSILQATAPAASPLPSDPIAWGADAAISTGGWGRLARLPDGSWLGVVTLFPAGQPSKLRILKSVDGGSKWSQVGELAEADRKLDNGDLTVSSGDLLLTARSVIDKQSYRLPVYRSGDEGKTWTRLGVIAANEGAPGTLAGKGLWEPFLLPLGGRKVAAFYADETRPGFSQVISEKVSTDGGATWGKEIPVVAPPSSGGALRPGMPVAARMVDGRTVLVYEVIGIGKGDVHRKVSRDGLTWEKGLGARVPCQRQGPFIAVAADGRLFLSSCSNQVSFSDDGGETWLKLEKSAFEFAPPDSWPALYEIAPGRLAAVSNVTGEVRMRIGDLRPTAWLDSFREEFEAGEATGWTLYQGGGEVDGGTYRLHTSKGEALTLTGSPHWTDGLLEADVEIESGGSSGLVFRAINPGDVGIDAFSGYFVGLDPAGKVHLGRMDGSGSKWKPLGEARAPAAKGRRSRLQVRMAGPAIQVFVDDPAKAKISINDATHRRGQVGLRVFESSARFDNVSFQGDKRASKGADPRPGKKS
jgi:BNR repeat protein/3-keto-disaccharide hydrolase